MREILGFFGFVLGLIVASFLFVSIIVLMFYPAMSYSCSRTGEAMSLETKFSIWTDCMVKTPGGRWMSMEKYQAIAIDEVPK